MIITAYNKQHPDEQSISKYRFIHLPGTFFVQAETGTTPAPCAGKPLYGNGAAQPFTTTGIHLPRRR